MMLQANCTAILRQQEDTCKSSLKPKKNIFLSWALKSRLHMAAQIAGACSTGVVARVCLRTVLNCMLKAPHHVSVYNYHCFACMQCVAVHHLMSYWQGSHEVLQSNSSVAFAVTKVTLHLVLTLVWCVTGLQGLHNLAIWPQCTCHIMSRNIAMNRAGGRRGPAAGIGGDGGRHQHQEGPQLPTCLVLRRGGCP